MTRSVRDELLVVRCQLGERDAFAELVRAWHSPMWRYVRRMVNSTEVADEVSQEVWIAVVRGIARLQRPERFASWVYTIARRSVMTHLRAEYARAERLPTELGPVTDAVDTGASAPDTDPKNDRPIALAQLGGYLSIDRASPTRT